MAHTHALTFFVAKGMIDAGAATAVPFAPPSFQAISRTIETVRSDAGHLFAAIARDNPFAPEARKELVRALARDRRGARRRGSERGRSAGARAAARTVGPRRPARDPGSRATVARPEGGPRPHRRGRRRDRAPARRSGCSSRSAQRKRRPRSEPPCSTAPAKRSSSRRDGSGPRRRRSTPTPWRTCSGPS